MLIDHEDGLGIFACGWLDDPQHRIKQIVVEESRDALVDLLREAVLSMGPDLADLFAVPPGVRAPLPFVLFLPDGTVGWRGGLTFAIAYVDGTRERHFVPAIGRISELDRITERAPPDDVLAIAARALAAWRDVAGAVDRLPRRLAELAERAYRKIAPPVDGGIDTALRVAASGILLRGRIASDEADHMTEAALISMFGRRVALPVPLPAVAGGDAEKGAGFLLFAEVADLRPDERWWFLEARFGDGSTRRLPFICPPPPARLTVSRRRSRSLMRRRRTLPSCSATCWRRRSSVSPDKRAAARPPLARSVLASDRPRRKFRSSSRFMAASISCGTRS